MSRISDKTQHTSWICLSDTDTVQKLLEEVLYLYHRDKITMLPTRWLSLGPAVERLLQSWPVIVSYFTGDRLSKESCQMLGAASDGSKRARWWRHSAQHNRGISSVFIEPVQYVWENCIAAGKRFCHLPVMSQLHEKLKDCLADRFFTAVATQILDEDMPCSKKTATEKNFCNSCSVALTIYKSGFISATRMLLACCKACLWKVRRHIPAGEEYLRYSAS